MAAQFEEVVVDADLATASYGVERETTGVREVEGKTSFLLTGDKRLAVRAVGELYFGWRLLQVSTDQDSQGRPPDDEAAAISLEAKLLGPLSFIRRETIFKPF